jgi:hypothetical protein
MSINGIVATGRRRWWRSSRRGSMLRVVSPGGGGSRWHRGANLLGARSIAPPEGSQSNRRSNAPRSARSAGFQPAGSPTSSRRNARPAQRLATCAHRADYQSAIRQATSLRYQSPRLRSAGAGSARWRSHAPRSARGAGFQPAGSPTSSRRNARPAQRLTTCAHRADYQSAIRQATSLRYQSPGLRYAGAGSARWRSHAPRSARGAGFQPALGRPLVEAPSLVVFRKFHCQTRCGR